ncbi:MAG: hypothetical protein OEZ34_13820, partial [Spirochaetia bacterium]|nr:hypothetical protein [Spirochaetia bacterium]
MNQNIKNRRYLIFSMPYLAFFTVSTVFLFISLLQRGIFAQETVNVVYENLNLPNWSGNDYAPNISPDGQFLIFQSDRAGYHDSNNLWISINKNYRNIAGDADWTPVIPLRFPYLDNATRTMKIVRPAGTLGKPDGAFSINTDGFEGMSSIRYSNYEPVEIFFTSKKEIPSGRDGYSGLNIYSSQFINERWTAPSHLNTVNSHFDDRMPAVSQDGNHLYFSSNRPGGYGGSDIWYSVRNVSTGVWEPAVNAGESVNSSYNEISPSVSEDGMLFFSSDRPAGFGHYDLYYSRTGENAKNLGMPFNSEHDDEYFSITHDGFWAYFSSDRDHPYAAGGMDLYRAVVPANLRGRVNVIFTGVILDGSTKKPLGLDATIKVDYEKETIVETSSIFQRDPGHKIVNNFKINLLSGRQYAVEISAPGFHPQKLILDYRGNVPSGKTDRRTIQLMPVKKDGDTLRDLRLI